MRIGVDNQMNEKYIVNLHLLESCNYSCLHCFAHFDSNRILTLEEWKKIIDNIASSNLCSRINLAGGEPLLYPQLNEVIEYIHNKNIDVSLITNGFLLTPTWIETFAPYLSGIGISIDSLIPNTLLQLGRCTNKKEILTTENVVLLLQTMNKNKVFAKINTVVSKLNYTEDFSLLFKNVVVDRWKILKMKTFENTAYSNKLLDISNKDYFSFVDRHQNIPNKIIESNLVNSYTMIDSQGNLVSNEGLNYKKIGNLKEISFIDAFAKLSLNKELYFSRY